MWIMYVDDEIVVVEFKWVEWKSEMLGVELLEGVIVFFDGMNVD